MVVRELVEQRYTEAEFWEIAARPENEEKRLEWEDGVIIETPSSTRLNTVTAALIVYFLNTFVRPNNLGFVTGADGGFRLQAAKRARRPNAAFISKSHGIHLVGVEFDVAPDLAVEVVSPDEDIFKKAREYLHSGTRIVWAVYAEEKTVYVMRLDADGSLRSIPFGVETVLDGGEVLLGFTLPVRAIFPEE